MWYKKVFTALLVLCSLQGFSQINLYEDDIKYGNEYGNSLVFTLPYCDKKMVGDEWKKVVANHSGKQSVKNIISGSAVQNSTITGISNQPVEVYYRILDTKSDTLRIATAFVLNDGQFVSSETHPTEYKNASLMLRDYAYGLQRRCVELELQDANQYSAKLNKKLAQLQSDKGKLESSNNILANKILLSKQKKQDLTKKIALQEGEDLSALTAKQAESFNKKLEANRRKLAGYEDDITSYEVKITHNKENIVQTNKDIIDISSKIKEQSLVVQQIEQKINTIQK